MKNLFKKLFSTESKSKKYKNEIIFICCLLLISSVIGILIDTLDLNSIVVRVVRSVLIVLCAILLFPCIIRILDISDYNEKNKVKNGKKKFKFKPLLCNITDIEKWIMNATTPDTLYIKSSSGNKITIISVEFETQGKNGPFINKQILINDKEIVNEKYIRQEIDKTCLIENDCVYLMAITEYNDPKMFNKILKD